MARADLETDDEFSRDKRACLFVVFMTTLCFGQKSLTDVKLTVAPAFGPGTKNTVPVKGRRDK
jgi:hypothetical protein